MGFHGRMAPGTDPSPERSHPSRQPHVLLARQSTIDSGVIFIVVAGAAVVLAGLFLGALYLKRRRKRPKGTAYEQTRGEDTDWHPLNSTAAPRNGRTSQPPNASANRSAVAAVVAAVDRNTSVRSVMTLPAYRQMASHTEQVLGREGERDGIDVIVDLPVEEELEALREEEMENMYQIRLTRQQQIAEQEQIREERRQAQQRGDNAALAVLRARARASNNSNSAIEGLRREMERTKEERQKSVSSVSYADLGLARHDGTRIRANSGESERMGLLSDVASMPVSQPSQPSGALSSSLHLRDHSGSSVVSIDSDSLGAGGARTGSSTELVEADLGDESMPPPGYEDLSRAAADDDDDDVEFGSTTPMNEPPPDYPGPYRSTSQISRRSLASQRSRRSIASQRSRRSLPPASNAGETTDGNSTLRPSRGVGGIPQLPSLRISQLPAIVIEPSSVLSGEVNEERD